MKCPTCQHEVPTRAGLITELALSPGPWTDEELMEKALVELRKWKALKSFKDTWAYRGSPVEPSWWNERGLEQGTASPPYPPTHQIWCSGHTSKETL